MARREVDFENELENEQGNWENSEWEDEALYYHVPIVKAHRESGTGRIKVIGLAGDHSPDLQQDIVQADKNPRCIDLINAGRAVFDLRHNSCPPPIGRNGPIVGRPEWARFITQDEARRKYPEYNIVGNPIELGGYVNALGNPKLAPEDLKILHHYADIGERVGFSIRSPLAGASTEVRDGRRYRIAVPGPIYKVAIAEQPMCPNAPCFLAKSLDAAFRGGAFGTGGGADMTSLQLEAATWDAQTPRMIVTGSPRALAKALSASGIVATPGTTGGDALKLQDLANRPGQADLSVSDVSATDKKGERRCLKCGSEVSKGKKYCGDCGELYKALPALVQDLAALLGLRVEH